MYDENPTPVPPARLQHPERLNRFGSKSVLAVSLMWPVAAGLSSPLRAETAGPTPSMAIESEAATYLGTDPALTTPSTASAEYREDPVQVLLEQAAYWRGRSEPSRAIDSLNRILTLGDNADALVMLAQIQAEEGQEQAALATLDRLRKEHGGDRRIAKVEQDIRIGQPDPSRLAEARALVREGRMLQAVAAYQQAFKGETPPDRYAAEYFLTLGGTSAGFDSAREGLGRLVSADPRNQKTQLAYAELLSHRENSREEAIERLVRLAQNSTVAEEADQSLRSALLWLPDDATSRGPVEAYVNRHPGDAELKQKLATILNPPRSPIVEGAQARIGGFDEMKNARLAEAERDFQMALSINPSDADAIAGLGYVRLRQNRIEEGRNLLKQALELGPTDAEGVKASLEGTAGGKGFDEAASREIKAQYARVSRLTQTRRYGEAESLLRHLAGATPDWGNYLQLGDIQSRAGKLHEAEDSFRRSLAMKPNNAAAKIGLAGVLLRRHRNGEAEALYAQLGDTHALGQLQAERLRSQARRITDPVAQAGLYVAAVKLDPANPWLRLELARALLRQGRPMEARTVMEGVGAGEQAVEAAFYFAVEINDLPRAAALAERIPAARRTAQMAALQQRVAIRAEIAQATQFASPAQLRNRLVGLAAQPDPTGVRVEEIARTFVSLNDKAAAGDAVETALAASRALTLQQRLAYSGALIGAGLDLEAERLLTGLEAERLTRDQGRAFVAMADALAVVQADKLREDGRYAEAQERLVRRLSSDPGNTGLTLALARVYRSRGQFGRAVDMTQALLDQYPGDLDVRRAAVDMMLVMGDLDRAKLIANEGLQNSPGDARAHLMVAEVARQRGDYGESRQELSAARQISADPSAVGSTGFQTSVSTGGSNGPTPNALGEARFKSLDPLAQRIENEIATLDDQITPQVRAGVGFLGRRGEAGLGRLSVVTAPVEGTFSPGGVGLARLQVTPTTIDGGTPSASNNSALQRFGSNQLRSALGLASASAGSQSSNGVGLNASYNLRFATFDIGATPLGFNKSNVVGGLELAPLVGPDLRLRVNMDRRAVVDSALSYAGARDPATGLTWGAVVRNRGYAQLEYAADRWFFYGGAGGGVVTGDAVRNNSFVEAQLGASYGLYRNGPQELRVGLSLPYYNYAQNQNFFSYGQGGYFSPQNYVAIQAPFTWRDQPTEQLAYKLTASIGFQSYEQNGALVFPNSPGLQAALNLAGEENSAIITSYAAQHTNGLTGAAAAEFEYKLSETWRLGGRAAYQKTGDYSEANAAIYCRYLFAKVSP